MPLPVGLATWTLRLPRIGPVVTPILSAASMRESMSAMSVAPRVSERVGDSGQGIPTLPPPVLPRSEEHTSELQSLMRISYAVFCLKKKKKQKVKVKIIIQQ